MVGYSDFNGLRINGGGYRKHYLYNMVNDVGLSTNPGVMKSAVNVAERMRINNDSSI